jgi:hypothetical protein
MNLNHDEMQEITQNGYEVSRKFTFEKYLVNLKNKVFNDN